VLAINIWPQIKNNLPNVQKPAQYIGGEYNQISKDPAKVAASMAFCFPDTYEIGMSHLGLRIIYEAINAEDDLLCERVFAPQADMEAKLRQQHLPLFSLENHRPLAEFDLIGFTLQYEMSYSNVLNMLELAEMPLLSDQRNSWPLVIAGGPCVYNPEPLSDFIDIFVIGEGEQVVIELMRLVKEVKIANGDKQELLNRALKIEGLYIPCFYKKVATKNGIIIREPQSGQASAVVKKRLCADLDKSIFPLKALLPNIQAVHDRLMLEIMRGCGRGCRFCQAGVIYRPIRERNLNLLREQARQLVAATGYEDIGLLSLSSADYSCISELIDMLIADHSCSNVGVALPSLRVDAFSVDLAAKVQQVRKSGLTFAPEAGSQRMRNIINKGVSEEDIFAATEAAFSQGYTAIKLYFMIGLPYENNEDVAAIADLTQRILYAGKNVKPAEIRKPLKLTLGVASFVPKPHTPFQWHGADGEDVLKEKQELLKKQLRPIKSITMNYHDITTSLLEAAFARGDCRLGKVLLRAHAKGCRFDGWKEFFRADLWEQAFEEEGLDYRQIAAQTFNHEDALPWQHISSCVDSDWLWQENVKAADGQPTVDCRNGECNCCGVCSNLDAANVLAQKAGDDHE